jgi:hypothetical protein
LDKTISAIKLKATEIKPVSLGLLPPSQNKQTRTVITAKKTKKIIYCVYALSLSNALSSTLTADAQNVTLPRIVRKLPTTAGIGDVPVFEKLPARLRIMFELRILNFLELLLEHSQPMKQTSSALLPGFCSSSRHIRQYSC